MIQSMFPDSENLRQEGVPEQEASTTSDLKVDTFEKTLDF